MTLQEQLEIIQATIDGKEIEYYSSINETWNKKDTKNRMTFNFQERKYRIKPEPKKEIKLHQYLIQNLTTKEYISTTGYYPDINACKQSMKTSYTYWKIIDKLPHTEITVTED